MRYVKLLMCALPLLALAACDDDGITDHGAPDPAATIRFVNAVPDLEEADFAFVDVLENLPTLKGVRYQRSSGFYQRAKPGDRPARVFPTSSDITETSTRLVDTSINLSANTRYTFMLTGTRANDDVDLLVTEDPSTPPSPSAGQIALQVNNARAVDDPIDVYVVEVDSLKQPMPANFENDAVHTFSSVGQYSNSGYADLPAIERGAGIDGPFYMFVVTDAGSTTALFSVVADAAGVPAPGGQASSGAQPGVQIEGSVLTIVLLDEPTYSTDDPAPAALTLYDKVLNP